MTQINPSPPLYYALVQARFNPIAAMENYIKSIQDKMRLEGYTLFTPQELNQLTFNKNAQPQAIVTKLPRWQITKQDQTAGFILDPASLTYHTTNYTTHEQFLNEFLSALHWIHDIVKLEHLSRIGLRYLNAVLPHNDEPVGKYLDNGLHGIVLSETLRYSFTESVFDTELKPFGLYGTLVSRCHYRYGLLGYPPDIEPNDLKTLPHFILKEPYSHAVLDIDHFTDHHMPIDFKQCKEILLALHAKIKNTLGAMTTDYAQQQWFKKTKNSR